MKSTRSVNLALGAIVAGAALLSAAPTVHAKGDAANGEKLYKASCTGCHDTTVHTRPDKIIFSKKALRNRVEFCEGNAQAGWNATQMDDVTEWLDVTFYKYGD